MTKSCCSVRSLIAGLGVEVGSGKGNVRRSFFDRQAETCFLPAWNGISELWIAKRHLRVGLLEVELFWTVCGVTRIEWGVVDASGSFGILRIGFVSRYRFTDVMFDLLIKLGCHFFFRALLGLRVNASG